MESMWIPKINIWKSACFGEDFDGKLLDFDGKEFSIEIRRNPCGHKGDISSI